jgi:hypothetical protein
VVAEVEEFIILETKFITLEDLEDLEAEVLEHLLEIQVKTELLTPEAVEVELMQVVEEHKDQHPQRVKDQVAEDLE